MKENDTQLSRRERQIMQILHTRGQATAEEVRGALADAPSYSAVRALLRILEEKGHVKHRREGLRYVHLPTEAKARASRSALRRVVSTFFGGSAPLAVAALLESADTELSPKEIDQLQTIIDQARKEGR
jgi:BlaI family transcriptional regulator, penicillinase repressor